MSLLYTMFDYLELGLVLAIQAGCYAGLLAIAVAIINIFFRRWLSPGQMALLWALVLLRLLVPIAPASPLSLQNLYLFVAQENEPAELRVVEANSPPIAYGSPASHPQPPDTVEISTEPVAGIELFLSLLPWIWFIVGSTGFTWTLIRHWRFCRRVNQTPRCTEERLLQFWDECCAKAGVSRTSSIVLFDSVEQPAVMGLFHQTLLLPTDAAELDDHQLQMIMFHELAHVRRWDIAANWLLVAIRAVHWWNPFYWLAASRFRSLREQACDAFVICRIDNQPVHDYSELLLKLAERKSSARRWRVMLPASILGFFRSSFRKRAVRSRLKALRVAGVTRGRWHTGTVVGIILLVAISGLTDASSLAPSTKHQPLAIAPIAVDLSKFEVIPVHDGPLVTRTYNIEKALNRVSANSQTSVDATKRMERVLSHLFQRAAEPRNEAAKNKSVSQLTFTIDDKTLSATAPAALHERLARTLDAWAESGLGQFSVQLQFVRAHRDLTPELGISWQSVEAFSSDRGNGSPLQRPDGIPIIRAESRTDDYFPVAVATLNESQRTAILNVAQANARMNVLSAPKLTLFNGQQASIADCTQRPFVIGVHETAGGAHKPKVTVIDEGSKITLRGTQTPDRKHVHLEATCSFCSIEDATTASATLSGTPVTIQIPRVKRLVFDVASEIEDGHSLLIGDVLTAEKHDSLLLLLTVTNLPDDLGKD